MGKSTWQSITRTAGDVARSKTRPFAAAVPDTALKCSYFAPIRWHSRRAFKSAFFTNQEIYRRATLLFNQHPRLDYIVELGVSCYLLEPSTANQMSILEEVNREAYLTEAVDDLNRRFGNYTVTFAVSAGAKDQIKQKIPFGSTRYFELLVQQA